MPRVLNTNLFDNSRRNFVCQKIFPLWKLNFYFIWYTLSYLLFILFLRHPSFSLCAVHFKRLPGMCFSYEVVLISSWPYIRTSQCRRTESIVSLERGFSSCAELQVFSCYRGWKEACQATRAISPKSRRDLSSFLFCKARRRSKFTPFWQKN